MSNHSIKLFQDLRENIKRPEYVLILTYSFDPRFFEETVVPAIKRNSPSCKIIVLTDEAEYVRAIRKTSIAGREYYLVPAPTRGIFHPKMILIASRKKTTLYIGSMNMTATGILTNVESVYRFSFTQGSNSEMLSEVSRFLKVLSEENTFIRESKTLKRTISDLIMSIYSPFQREKRTGRTSFIHNMEEPLISRVLKLLEFDPSEISVMGPFYGDFSLVEYLRKKFPRTRIDVYLQNGRFMGTPEKLKHLENVQIFDVKNERYLHAKILAFSTEKETLLYLGSANPTRAAFLQTNGEGGNLEIGLVIRFSREEFDKFMKAVGKTEKIKPEDLRAKEEHLQAGPTYGSVGVAEFKDGVLRIILRTDREIESVIINTGHKRVSIEEFEITRKRDFVVVTIRHPDLLNKRETAFIEINNQLTVPVIMEKGEHQKFEHIEDQIMSNTVFNYTLRSQLEWILANLEFTGGSAGLKKPSIKIPGISLPRLSQSYKRLSTIDILRGILRKLQQIRKEIPHDISRGDYELARGKIEKFLSLLLEAYPYFSPHVKREFLRRIKELESNMDNIQVYVTGNQVKFLKWQLRVEDCEILTTKKDLEDVFELDDECTTIRVKQKIRFRDLVYKQYSEEYDKLTNQEMKLILYSIFKSANSFLSIVQLSPHLQEDEVDEFKTHVNMKILALYFLTSILDNKFSRLHINSPTVHQAYKELLEVYSEVEIGRRIWAEATEVIEKLNEALDSNFIQTPHVEDALALLQDIQSFQGRQR